MTIFLGQENFNMNEPEQSNQTTHTKFKTYKIIVLGNSGVGKTCLSFRFCSGRFPNYSEATIGLDFREKVTSLMVCISFMDLLSRSLRLMERD